jgi:tetratricopeptide (TPR) repeat protein
MDALLVDLTRDRRRAVRRAGAVGALVFAAGLVVFGVATRARSNLCAAGASKLAGVWDDATKAAVRSSFVATGKPYAEDTYARVAQVLDARATAWVGMYVDSCEATHVRGEQSAAMLDLRTTCLEQRRLGMASLTQLFAREADGALVDRAVPAALELPRLDACADTRALGAAIAPPSDPSLRATVDELRARIARSKALDDAGRYAEALELAQQLATEARATTYEPVEMEALAVLARVQRDLKDGKAAEATTRTVTTGAARVRNDALAVEAWINLIHVVGMLQSRYADALALRVAAEASIERVGGDPLAKAKLLGTLGAVRMEQGEYADGAALIEQAIATFEESGDPEGPVLATFFANHCLALHYMERFADARRSCDRAIAMRERVLGPDHPDVAVVINLVGSIVEREGKAQEAVTERERAIAIYRNAKLENHPNLANALNNLGNAWLALGENDRAREAYEQSLAIRRRVYGEDHPDVATSLHNLGNVSDAMGSQAEAVTYFEKALAIREKVFGPEHPRVATTLIYLGAELSLVSRAAEGLPLLERGLAIREKKLGATSAGVALALTWLGHAHLALHNSPRALPLLERALSIYEAKGAEVEQGEVFETRFTLARALWETTGGRKRALALATEARDHWQAMGSNGKKNLVETNTWLTAHLSTHRP